MSNYQAGDKVVLRDDLTEGVQYGTRKWYSAQTELLEDDYLVIHKVLGDGLLTIQPSSAVGEGEAFHYISEGMIQGFYAGTE